MSIFTLAIFCLTTSSSPWLMDLTFQVPMQYCSLQHQILLPSPVTSTTGCCFHFGSASSFFLELFLQSSPVAYWAPTELGSSFFSVISFCLSYFHGILNTRILKRFAIPFSSGPCFVKAVYCHLAYLNNMQSTSCEMLGWIKHRLESRLLGETQ